MNQKQHENLDMSRIVSPSSGLVGSKKSTLSPSAQQPPPQYQHTFLLNEYQPANKTSSQTTTTTTPTKAASLKGRQKQLKQPPPPQRLDSESISSTLSVEMSKPAVRPSLAAAADTTGAATTSPALCFSPRVDVEQKNPWIQSSPSIRKSSLDKADSSRRNSVSFTSDNRLLAPSSTSSSSSKDPKLAAADQSDDTATTSAGGGGLSFPQFVKNLQNFTPALPKKQSYTNIHHTKPNRRAQVYNFLERPTGWKCFIYHFTVYYNRLI